MDCERHLESLIESARGRKDPAVETHHHLRSCEPCAERWESEVELAACLKSIRTGSAHLRSSAGSRAALMREFNARKVKVLSPRWYWGIAAAAALVFGLAMGPQLVSRLHQAPTASLADEASLYSETDPDGFIAVPYASPLADGEMMRIVHTELNPAALASLGVSVDPAWTTQLPADLLLGEDGMPRAVRIADVESEEGGF